MRNRERYRRTLLFEGVDKTPMYLGLARESTLENWHAQGLPKDRDYQEVIAETLGLPPEALLRRRELDVAFRLRPEFETQIREHRDGHYIIRDWSGAVVEISDAFDESYLRRAKDFVTRKWWSFPVENREDWADMKRRYNPDDPNRLPANFEALCAARGDSDEIYVLDINGIFWQLREWCGFENLCVLMLEDPDFVREMAAFWTEYVLALLGKVLPRFQLDSVFISEDMAYKAHPMISPEMTREFILPAHKKWVPAIRRSGCPLIELDSDGYIDDLIPLWIEAGINCCSPIEVAAHCDLLAYRRRYGKRMAYLQGIDKRRIAQGGRAMEEYLEALVPPLLRDGGYIPGCDHGVPNDVTWQNYLSYARRLAQLCGWLP